MDTECFGRVVQVFIVIMETHNISEKLKITGWEQK